MKLFKKLRKGFTLIELVVVIAVIAILSAVSVVSYVAITNKAKESNDHMMIDQINLSVESSSIQSRKNTLHEVLEDLEEDAGFGVEKLTPELKDTEFVYSYSMNKFAYWKKDKVVYPKDVAESSSATGEDLWFFKDVQSGANLAEGHSYYVKSAPAGAAITVDGGIDVGSLSFSSIAYTNPGSAKDVVIRTNGGKLTVNAPNDTVNHYAVLNEVTISDVASTDCYHEYGTVKGQLNIAKGKVVLESKANVGFVNVTATSADAIAVEIKSGADYGRLTCEDETILAAVATASNVPTEKTMKTEEGTVAIVDGVAYTNITEALSSFTANKTFELFTDIKNAVNSGVNYAINIPENGTIDGHGYCLEGNIKFDINAKGAIVKNLVFHMTENKATRSAAQVERYGEADTGTLSSLYASGLSGKVVIEGCTFDTAEWDAIQITPVAGAEIVIKNNIFKHTNDSFKQNRYVHIQSSKNIDFSATISNNDFFDCDYLIDQAVELYYPTTESKITISHNYMENYATAVQQNHAACIGFRNGAPWIKDLNNYNMSNIPNN